MILDQRYFNRVATKQHNGYLLESYKAVHARSTMVLFSRKSRTPLAALTLTSASDVGCLSLLTGRPSPKHTTQPYFQGMLSMPDQTFNFVITNLSDDGMINFNVLHTPHRVSVVDPGPSYGVNQVNELHTNQSYEIKADQRTNRSMVLSGKTKEKFDPITKQSKVVPLTVEESESTKDKTKEGLYFYLSVVPDIASPALVKKFEEGTVWKAAPGFVRKTQPPPPPAPRSPFDYMQRLGCDSSFVPFPGSSRINHPEDLFCETSYNGGGGSGGGANFSFGASGHYLSARAPQRYSGRSLASNAPGQFYSDLSPSGLGRAHQGADSVPGTHLPSGPFQAGEGAEQGQDLFDLHERECSPHRSAARLPTGSAQRWTGASAARSPRSGTRFRSTVRAMSAMTRINKKRGKERREEVLTYDIDDDNIDMYRGSGGGQEDSNCRAAFAASVNVRSTQAGELAYGEHVDVISNCTGHEYAYEHASEPTVLCMSIWEEMKFLPLLDTVDKMLEAEMKDLIDNEGKSLIESLNAIFKEDKCVIDLESEADTIVCTCGHQCINHANVNSDLRRCPLCRSPVTAFVRTDGIVV